MFRVQLTIKHCLETFQVNKSENFICVKLFQHGDYNSEISLPAYVPVPPNDSIYARFDPRIEKLTLSVLYGNPAPVPATYVLSGERRSPCAAVENFPDVMVYSIPAKGCNVLLKFKHEVGVELRIVESLMVIADHIPPMFNSD